MQTLQAHGDAHPAYTAAPDRLLTLQVHIAISRQKSRTATKKEEPAAPGKQVFLRFLMAFLQTSTTDALP